MPWTASILFISVKMAINTFNQTREPISDNQEPILRTYPHDYVPNLFTG